MKKLHHGNVVRLYDVLTSKTKIFLVLELITGGELFERIATGGKFSERIARQYIQQLTEGMAYIHDQGVAHRDLKPENLLLNAEGDLKISDFGLSAILDHDRLLTTTCGTPNYIAPEILTQQPYNGRTADVWSIGVIMYVLMAGYMPFEDPSHSTLMRNIRDAKYQCPSWFSSDARDLLDRMLTPDPAHRINIADIQSHPWVMVQDSPSLPTAQPLGGQVSKSFTEAEGERLHVPPDITAFDVIGLSGALNLTPMLNRDDEEKGLGIFRATCFVSSYEPLKILGTLLPVLQRLGANCQTHEPSFKMRVAAPTKRGILQISVQVFRIHETRFICEFRRASGDVLDFHAFFNDVLDTIPGELVDTSHYSSSGLKGLKRIVQKRRESVALMMQSPHRKSRVVARDGSTGKIELK